MLSNVAWNAMMQPDYHVTESYVRVMWMQWQWCRPMTRLAGDKPETCGVLSHHANNKTNVLPTCHVLNLLTGTSLLSTFFIHKNVAK